MVPADSPEIITPRLMVHSVSSALAEVHTEHCNPSSFRALPSPRNVVAVT